MKGVLVPCLLLMASAFSGFAQSVQRIPYRQVDTITLHMEVHMPDIKDGTPAPAILFFFGGGWNGGTIRQFEPHASYLAGRGMVCFLVEYRVRNVHATTPFDALKDAKSAVRFVRDHAAEFHVDTSRIAASGGSAGGHLAAATALIRGYDEETGEGVTSCVPNALILFNPVIDNGPGGYGYERIGEAYKDFSPLHNIRRGAPPTLFFLGTNDRLIPVETAQYFKTVMEKVGSRCDLHLYEGEGHGFFNYRSLENYTKTLLEADRFLVSLGYLSGAPTLEWEE